MAINVGPKEIQLRIEVLNPPANVKFAVQSGRTDLIGGAPQKDGRLMFDFAIKVKIDAGCGSISLSGSVVQGPVGSKFIYVNSGVRAGQKDSCWDRRAKVPLTKLSRKMLESALGRFDCRLAAAISGVSADGGPACASVRLIEPGWIIETVDGRS